MHSRLQSHLKLLDEMVELLRNNTLRDRSGPASGPFGAVPAARRMQGRTKSLKLTARKELGLIKDKRVLRLVRLWLLILNANMDLRTDVADAVDIVDGRTDVDRITQEKAKVEALTAAMEISNLLDQETANQKIGLPPSSEDRQRVDAMQIALARRIVNEPRIAGAVKREFTDEEVKKILGTN